MASDGPVDERECILVVDDEDNIRHAIAINLNREGFRVLHAATGSEALEQMRYAPDAVVLDVMLPGLDGLAVLRRIREISAVPVLIVSAKVQESDRIVGLEIGADDYLTKPFAMRELIARVRAMVRRRRMDRDESVNPRSLSVEALHATSTGRGYAVGDVRIEPGSRQAFLGETELQLKPKEFDLLAYLTRHAGLVLSREALLREVWGYQHRVDTRTVDVHVRWLRQKLEEDPSVPQRLLTVRGHGYRFVPLSHHE